MTILDSLFQMSQENDRSLFAPALSDLRYIIERYTMNRFGKEEQDDYYGTFYNKSLIDFRLSLEDLKIVKYFLFHLLINYPDRSTLTAKCIKVLFDTTLRNAICVGIEIYWNINDDTTCELIFAITDAADPADYFSNNNILNLFKKISENGGENSRKAVRWQLEIFNKYKTF